MTPTLPSDVIAEIAEFLRLTDLLEIAGGHYGRPLTVHAMRQLGFIHRITRMRTLAEVEQALKEVVQKIEATTNFAEEYKAEVELWAKALKKLITKGAVHEGEVSTTQAMYRASNDMAKARAKLDSSLNDMLSNLEDPREGRFVEEVVNQFAQTPYEEEPTPAMVSTNQNDDFDSSPFIQSTYFDEGEDLFGRSTDPSMGREEIFNREETTDSPDSSIREIQFEIPTATEPSMEREEVLNQSIEDDAQAILSTTKQASGRAKEADDAEYFSLLSRSKPFLDRDNLVCLLCDPNFKFRSVATLENHVNSNRHQTRLCAHEAAEDPPPMLEDQTAVATTSSAIPAVRNNQDAPLLPAPIQRRQQQNAGQKHGRNSKEEDERRGYLNSKKKIGGG